MSLGYAPRQQAPTKSSHDVNSVGSPSDSWMNGLLGLQGTWGNQAIAALVAARDAAIPAYAPLAGALQHEGWSALLNPFDAMARQEGREVLSGRLRVLAEGERRTGLPNEVTAQEFEQLAALYGDIRMGSCNLLLDTEDLSWAEADAFRAGALEDITALMQTPSGWLLLDELAYNGRGKQTRLQPALSPEKAEEDPDLTRELFNGEGSSVTVRYVPGQDAHISEASWGTVRSDVVLAHELTHAWYDTRGERADMSYWLRGLPAEFQAVGLGGSMDAPVSENAYRAERAAMAGQFGSLPGDKDMPRRTRY